MHPALLSRRALRTSLLSLALVGATACGDPKPPAQPDPPQVSLTIPEPNTAARSLKVTVTVSGCDKVAELSLYDRDTFLKTFTYSGPDTPLELASNDIKYTSGIAASLALKAQATCSDGRKNVSQPQSATFFPVEQLITDPKGEQVVTDLFLAEGRGTKVNFIGCGNPATGQSTLYRVDSAGTVLKTVDMDIVCNPDTVVTPRNEASGKRWVWTPGSGALAVDDNFVITGRTSSGLDIEGLSVMSNGDALITEGVTRVSRLQHTASSGSFTWTYAPTLFDKTAALPIERGADVLFGVSRQKGTTDILQVVVTQLNGATGAVVTEHALAEYNGKLENVPTVAFSPDGAVAYIGFVQANNQSKVMACITSQDGCAGTNQKWTRGTLPGTISALIPYAAGTRLAVISAQRVWFLDTASGTIKNKGGLSVDASGSLRILQVQTSRSTSSEFYLLNGPARSATGPATLPVEIVGVDSAELGEVFRYEVASSLAASVDDDGRLWIRVGNKLVQALKLSQYRQVHP
ncbi:hypothetical protein JGU66_24905 [Myxococcaceae bacterium JPH2]|nr:hypothetical protein [Myxococcaceae bacterium JPH2]